MHPYQKTMAELCTDLKQKKISSVELTQIYLERIRKYDPALNSFITFTQDQALADAKKADEIRVKETELPPLLGLPFAHKDIFCTTGVLTSCGSKMLSNFVSPYDATVVERLKAAGTILLGKTNMDEFAMGSSNETSFYGATKNPWDLKAVPGGSSGGSAAAVAGRLVPAATGTDTGGSIRQPAALCGITGLKPTYGRISRYGMIAFASSLDQAGPMALTAEDCALLMNVMAGFDDKDSNCLDHPVPDYTKTLNDSIDGLRIGIPSEYFGEGLDPEVAQLVEAAIRYYEGRGAQIKSIRLPHNHLSIPAYYIVAPAESSSNLARYDGVRFGYRCEDPKDLEDLYKRTRGEGFGPEVKRRIMVGTYALSAGYFDAYYVQAQKIRQLISNDYREAFKEVDVIMGPTAPTPAFNLGDRVNDPIKMYLSDIYTIAVNLAGLPAISIPVGFVGTRPVGLQITGHYFEEAKLLNVAHQYQMATDWHRRLPELS